jgi:tetratricopeptide (TPR) repeat protein
MNSIASLFLNQKKWDDAEQWFEKLIAADPANADAYYSLGYIAWSKWYPEYRSARARLGMRPDAPGPIADFGTKQDLAGQVRRCIGGRHRQPSACARHQSAV